LGFKRGAGAFKGLRADQDDNADKAQGKSDHLARAHRFARNEEMRKRQDDQRRRRHGHPREARGDILLTPCKQAERHGRAGGTDKDHGGNIAARGGLGK